MPSFASMFVIAAAVLSSQDISAAGPSGELKGTWTRASDPKAPIILIIPGSGPTDRDGNNPLGIQAGSYRLLSEGLATEGVSTVRIDKRGMFGSAGAVTDVNAVTIKDYVSDVRAWVKAIRSATGADCIWLLGHSEGGLVALASARDEPKICGLILVATPGRPLGDVLKEQLSSNPANGPLLPLANTAIDKLASGRHIDSSEVPAALAPLFDPAIQGFLISAFSLDPAGLAAQTALPMLILQGERDLQIKIQDAMALKAAAPSAVLKLFPDTNHVLKLVTSDDAGANIATYTDPDRPLAPGTVDAISDFMRSINNLRHEWPN